MKHMLVQTVRGEGTRVGPRSRASQQPLGFQPGPDILPTWARPPVRAQGTLHSLGPARAEMDSSMPGTSLVLMLAHISSCWAVPWVLFLHFSKNSDPSALYREEAQCGLHRAVARNGATRPDAAFSLSSATSWLHKPGHSLNLSVPRFLHLPKRTVIFHSLALRIKGINECKSLKQCLTPAHAERCCLPSPCGSVVNDSGQWEWHEGEAGNRLLPFQRAASPLA